MLGAAIATKQEALIWAACHRFCHCCGKSRTHFLAAPTTLNVRRFDCRNIFRLHAAGHAEPSGYSQFPLCPGLYHGTALGLDRTHLESRSSNPHIRFRKAELLPAVQFLLAFYCSGVIAVAAISSRTGSSLLAYHSVMHGRRLHGRFHFFSLHLDYQLRTAFYRLTAHILPLFVLIAASISPPPVGAVNWNGSSPEKHPTTQYENARAPSSQNFTPICHASAAPKIC